MGKAFIQESTLTDIANAIRTKNGTNNTYLPSQMAAAIDSIPTGGTVVEEQDVNFYDYDGTLLYSYTKAEALALTALPALPDRTSENLTNEGWNWTLAEIKTQLQDVGCIVNIGCTYYTTDGKSYVWYDINPLRNTVSLNIQPSVANDVVIDWGDESTDTISTTSATVVSHTYSNITVANKKLVTISANNNYSIPSGGFVGTNSGNYTLNKVILSKKITSLASRCFDFCINLQICSIPSTIILNTHFFRYCYSLRYFVIGTANTTLNNYAFAYCYSLEKCILPSSITNIGTESFRDCRSMTNITLPKGLIDTTAGGVSFYYCQSLKCIYLPSTISSLGSSVFRSCSNLQEVYIRNTTPPTIGTRVFEATAAVIYVPRASYNDYITETNWSDWAANIYPYDF